MKWFKEEAPNTVKKVEFVFPIVGHSFLPPDRVFGRIEKVIRREGTIETPDKYMTVFKEFGKVKHLGSDVPVHDWKSAIHEVIKSTAQWPFKLSLCKRIILTKDSRESISVRGEVHYSCDTGVQGSILKKGKSLSGVTPVQLENKIPVKRAKLKDVSNLLGKHFGGNWREREELVYYKTVIDGQDGYDDVPEEDENIEQENVDEVPDLVV